MEIFDLELDGSFFLVGVDGRGEGDDKPKSFFLDQLMATRGEVEADPFKLAPPFF